MSGAQKAEVTDQQNSMREEQGEGMMALVSYLVIAGLLIDDEDNIFSGDTDTSCSLIMRLISLLVILIHRRYFLGFAESALAFG